MAILRNSYVCLLRTTPASDDADSGPLRLVPTDGDPTEDAGQRIFGYVFAEQQGAGSVRAQVLASFGDGLWAIFGERTLTADGQHFMGFEDIGAIPPYVRFRVTAFAPDGSEVKPNFVAAFRLASNAPFRGEPANVPVIIERHATDNVFPNNEGNNEPPPEGGGA